MIDDDLLARAVEDVEALGDEAWTALDAALAGDPASRARLAAELARDDRLSRLLDPGRGSVAHAVRWRLERRGASGRFVPAVLGRVRRARRWRWAGAAALAAGIVAAIAIASHPRLQRGPGSLAVSGAQVELASDAVLCPAPRPELVAGRAAFSVAPHDAADPFTVVAPHATITALGTGFTVVAGDATVVEVQHGRVRVAGERGAVEIGADERATVGADGAPGASRRIATFPLAAQTGWRWHGVAMAGRDGPEIASLPRAPSYTGVFLGLGDDVVGAAPTARDQRVVVRYRLERPVPRLVLQCYDRELAVNFISPPLPREPGRWHDVEVPLAAMHPVDRSLGPWRAGDRIAEIGLYVDGSAGDVVRLADIGYAVGR